MDLRSLKTIEWVLRIAVFGTFFGHGTYAIMVNAKWITYLNTVGFSDELAIKIMPVIGMIDVIIAFIILIRPVKPVILYAVIWAFLAAAIRPVSGESLLQFIERASNWAAPLALYILVRYNSKAAED